MELSDEQKQEFMRRGFIQIPGVVPRVMLDAALRAINHSVGQGMNVADMPTLRSQSYCPELQNSPLILALLRATKAWPLVEAALGAGKVEAVRGAQIALRFPSLQTSPGQPAPHLDGIHTPWNGVPEGTLHNFSMLACILLSDLPEPNAGNFTVWPGTHRSFEEYFRAHGTASLLNGLPAVPLPEPYQITGRAGDVILAHYQVAHSAAAHIGPHIRYAVFYRLKHIAHDSHRSEAMTNIWLDWEGMKDIVAADNSRLHSVV